MRLLSQKVLSAGVSFKGKFQGSYTKGLFIFLSAMKGEKIDVSTLSKKIFTQQGVFGASMQVKLVNDGPTTFWLDSKN